MSDVLRELLQRKSSSQNKIAAASSVQKCPREHQAELCTGGVAFCLARVLLEQTLSPCTPDTAKVIGHTSAALQVLVSSQPPIVDRLMRNKGGDALDALQVIVARHGTDESVMAAVVTLYAQAMSVRPQVLAWKFTSPLSNVVGACYLEKKPMVSRYIQFLTAALIPFKPTELPPASVHTLVTSAVPILLSALTGANDQRLLCGSLAFFNRLAFLTGKPVGELCGKDAARLVDRATASV